MSAPSRSRCGTSIARQCSPRHRWRGRRIGHLATPSSPMEFRHFAHGGRAGREVGRDDSKPCASAEREEVDRPRRRSRRHRRSPRQRRHFRDRLVDRTDTAPDLTPRFVRCGLRVQDRVVACRCVAVRREPRRHAGAPAAVDRVVCPSPQSMALETGGKIASPVPSKNVTSCPTLMRPAMPEPPLVRVTGAPASEVRTTGITVNVGGAAGGTKFTATLAVRESHMPASGDWVASRREGAALRLCVKAAAARCRRARPRESASTGRPPKDHRGGGSHVLRAHMHQRERVDADRAYQRLSGFVSQCELA